MQAPLSFLPSFPPPPSCSIIKIVTSQLALKPRSPPLNLRLTTIRPSSATTTTWPAIPAHAGAELNIHPGRGGEAEALGHLDEIELVDVEDGAEGVRGVGLQVGAVAVFGGLGEGKRVF
jgi:hypothetical protein